MTAATVFQMPKGEAVRFHVDSNAEMGVLLAKLKRDWRPEADVEASELGDLLKAFYAAPTFSVVRGNLRLVPVTYKADRRIATLTMATSGTTEGGLALLLGMDGQKVCVLAWGMEALKAF